MVEMRIAILTNPLNSFYKPLADGLARMILELGDSAVVFYEGHDLSDFRYTPKPIQEGLFHFFTGNINRLRKKLNQDGFLKQLCSFDLIVLVANIPFAFVRQHFRGLEQVRRMRPELPIVQYNYAYLPQAGKGPLFQTYFGDGFKEKAFGLERFDHYLIVNLHTPQPLDAAKHPVTEIGCHLDDGSLYPEQEEFRVLLDFPKEGKEAERAVQLQALKQTGIPYETLRGSYSIQEIRKIYRRSSAYFIAFQESFGFPVCELQGCGSLIFSPYRSWLYSHSMKEDIRKPGFGSFTENFVLYQNDPDLLVEKLKQAALQHDAKQVRETFLRQQGHFFRGNPDALKTFIDKVKKREIHGQSHLQHKELNALIDMKDYCEPPY